MRFRSYDALRLFDQVARRLSFRAAAVDLNLTKGAVSYRVRQLEEELGFAVFDRQARGIALTEKGKALWLAAQTAFHGLEQEIAALRAASVERITIGMTTYFASRWLSPRLMGFMTVHPDIALRLQPVIGPINVRADDIDMAIRWGRGEWTDMEIEPLLECPAFATAGAAIAGRVGEEGLAAVLPELTLLHDREDSQAWADWHRAAGLDLRARRGGLVIPDPNVRVQAVIDGQGVALNDALVAGELAAGTLARISPVELGDYGYFLAYPHGALTKPALKAFRDWIVAEAAGAAALPAPAPFG
jgi:DNA-binding transcriptional LysR family regulator